MTDTGAQLAVNHHSLIAFSADSQGRSGSPSGLQNHVTHTYLGESGNNTMNNLSTGRLYLLNQDSPQVQTSHFVNQLNVQEGAVAIAPSNQDHVNNQQVGLGSSNSGTASLNHSEQLSQSGQNNHPSFQGGPGHHKHVEESHEMENAEEGEALPTIDIVINNVVSSFSTRCHLNLKKIALEGCNVMYRRESGMVSMKLRRPYTTASIWSSGKITCTGATSEEQAKIAARRFARAIQNLGYNVKFVNFRIVNVLGTCSFPFGIRINQFSKDHSEHASYEPELHPGVTYKIKGEEKATLKIFSTGSVTVTAPCVRNVQLAIEHIFPLVYSYRMNINESKKNSSQGMHLMPKNRMQGPRRSRPAQRVVESDDESLDGSSDDDFDSDESQD